MSSLFDSLSASEKTSIVIDIGHAYTKCGFAGSSSPRHIIPTSVLVNEKEQHIFDNQSDLGLLREQLTEFIRLIYYKYIIANCRDRRVVLVESVITPTKIRHLLTDIFLKQFEASSLAFVPSHLAATFTLGRVPLAVQFDSLPYAGKAIHGRIQQLLEQHASVTKNGKKQLFKDINLKLDQEILEDIKVRCCFVSPFERAQIYAENDLLSPEKQRKNDDVFKSAGNVDYPVVSDMIIHIPGIVRELACEVLFEQDIDGKSIATLLLDSLVQSALDIRRQLADNILIIGGTAMMPGFLHRLNSELIHLANVSTYNKKLAIKTSSSFTK
ncbi:unnamed protein product [Didymodactylos carnosus]|uniref:Actin-related protein 10 n=1 Tax=Didymodactylos carnosus TaxID=1234261 RepID=A0A8S2HU73_9BILA|nr:unnamed protein product [Didymodactylos carnosus]CAF3683596.1 unnamed protein product [Didymodactylos carnosus]